MCELFGVSSTKPVPVNDMLREFYSHSPRHPNGWGMANLYEDGAVVIEKEPMEAAKSAYLKQRLSHKMEVTTLLAHIRLATMGNMEYDNSHPFFRKDNFGRKWVLIHNGTIFDYPALNPYQYQQEGSTDSERILLYLVDQISRRQTKLRRPLEFGERFDLLEKLITDMAPNNKLNLLFYDGEYLYAHTNYANSLYVWEYEDTAIFCTVPLKKGNWQPVPFTTLCAYRDGQLVRQGKSHGMEYFVRESDMKYLFTTYANL